MLSNSFNAAKIMLGEYDGPCSPLIRSFMQNVRNAVQFDPPMGRDELGWCLRPQCSLLKSRESAEDRLQFEALRDLIQSHGCTDSNWPRARDGNPTYVLKFGSGVRRFQEESPESRAIDFLLSKIDVAQLRRELGGDLKLDSLTLWLPGNPEVICVQAHLTQKHRSSRQ